MTIGQDITPGIVTDIESLPSVTVGGLSTANVMLVGQGDLSESEAEPNTPYTVTRSSEVRQYFGTDNMIANGINDALNEGALPVYAVMTDEEQNTETIDSISGVLQNTPVSEDADDFDIEGYTVEITLGRPEEVEDEGAVRINPVTGEYEFGATPDLADLTYTSYDYSGALEALDTEDISAVDYVYTLNENQEVQNQLENTVDSIESFHEFAIAGTGTSPLMSETEKSDYKAEFDNSRMQVFYPSRNADGDSIMGAIGGLKASLGINGSSMNKRLSTHDRLIDRIDFNDEEKLLSESTVPVASQTRGALLVDDPTCISEDNQEEANMADGYSRLVVDRVTEITRDTERPYIGKLNKASTRGSLQASIRTAIGFLEEQDAVEEYSVRVHRGDSMSAYVDLQVDTTDPLRNIYNTISVGQ